MTPFATLHHACLAVPDAERALAVLDGLGIGPWQPYPPLAEYTELEVPEREAFLALRYSWTPLGRHQLQVVEPPPGPTPQRAFLERSGPGVYHLGFVVPDVDAAEAEARGLGLAVLARGRRDDGSGFAYLDARERAGVVLLVRQSRAGTDEAALAASAPADDAAPFRRLHHVCLVVRDLERATAAYAALGIGPWHDLPPMNDLVELAGPEPAAFHALRYRFAALGDVQLQLVEPGAGTTPQGDALAAHGEGVFHLGFSVDDLDVAEAAARRAGLGVILRGRRADGSGFSYFDTRERGLGVTLQVRRPPAPRP